MSDTVYPVRNVLTNAGKALITSSLESSKAVVFVYAKLGTGDDNVSKTVQQLEALTALDEPISRNATIKKKSVQGANNLVVSVQFQNKDTATSNPVDITTEIYITEIGVYAKLDGQNNSSAILFSYMTFGSYPDLMLGTQTAIVQRVYDIPYVFSRASDATVTISGAAMITEEDVITNASSGGSSLSGKIVALNSNGKLDVSITGDANTLDGHDSSYIATASHTHNVATSSAHGFMSKTDKAAHDTLVNRVNQDLKTSARPTFEGLNLSDGYIDNARFR